MACGSDILKSSTPLTRDEDPFDNQAGIETIKTPFGSGFEFIPPKITQGNRFVCLSAMRLPVPSVHQQRSWDEIDKIMNNANGENDVYIGYWFDQNQKRYSSLPTYILEHMDLEFINSMEGEGEGEGESPFIWWDTHIESQIVEVWQAYDSAYRHLVKTELLPELFDYEDDRGEDEHIPFYKRIWYRIQDNFQARGESLALKKNPLTIEPPQEEIASESSPHGSENTNSIQEAQMALANESGLIGKTFQRLHKDRLLLADLARKNGTLTEELTKGLSNFLMKAYVEMNFHKNLLSSWE